MCYPPLLSSDCKDEQIRVWPPRSLKEIIGSCIYPPFTASSSSNFLPERVKALGAVVKDDITSIGRVLLSRFWSSELHSENHRASLGFGEPHQVLRDCLLGFPIEQMEKTNRTNNVDTGNKRVDVRSRWARQICTDELRMHLIPITEKLVPKVKESWFDIQAMQNTRGRSPVK